ncbi:MAG: hypothetical protein R3F61_23985 [Myxococcota bacterium]
MKVHVQATGRRVAPFDEPIGDTWIHNRPLSAWQDDALAGFERAETPEAPCLVVPDTLFASRAVLERFVAEAAGRTAVLVLAESRFATSTTPIQPGVVACEGGFRFTEVRFVGEGAEPVDIVVDPDEAEMTIPLPVVFGGPATIALPRHPVMTIHHWAHILWASQAASSMVVRATPWWRAALRIVWAVIRARSIDKWRVMARLNTIGKGCDIHPTAVIEASTLGDHVTVGPFARVAFSTVGDGATILSGAEVEASTIGQGATVGQRSGVRMCVLYPEAFASQVQMQACVLGRRVLTTPGSFSIDLNLDREIRVPLDGKLHSTGTQFLGSAFGHEARVGTGVWLASGRSIPNGALVVKDPKEVVSRIPETAGDKPLVNRDGTLTPLD